MNSIQIPTQKPRKKQVRVVLDPKYRPQADEILQQTGISTLSQLFAILLVNYGESLVNSLHRSAKS